MRPKAVARRPGTPDGGGGAATSGVSWKGAGRPIASSVASPAGAAGLSPEMLESPNAERIGAILAAAAAIFSHKGFAATTMREIASRSGASLGSIYYHFRSKEEILRALICGNFRRVQRALEERLTGQEGPRETLELLVENHVDFFARHLDEMRVMSHELDTLGGAAGREVAALRRAYFERLRGLLGELRPDLTDADLHVATLSLFGMLNWTYRWIETVRDTMEPAALGRRMSALFLDGFLNGAPRRRGGPGGAGSVLN